MNQEITTTGILSLFETTKEERLSFCNDLIEKIDNGEADALKIHLQIKSAEDMIKRLNENSIYKKHLLDAAEKMGGKSFDFHNAKFEIKEVGVKYDYSQCNDPELSEMSAQLTDLEAKVKARQKFLQMIPLAGMAIITNDGEAVTVYPPSKSSTTSVAVTLK